MESKMALLWLKNAYEQFIMQNAKIITVQKVTLKTLNAETKLK